MSLELKILGTKNIKRMASIRGHKDIIWILLIL